MSPHLNNLWADQGWVGVANVWRVIISVLWAEPDLGLLNRVVMLRGPGDCSPDADKFTNNHHHRPGGRDTIRDQPIVNL